MPTHSIRTNPSTPAEPTTPAFHCRHIFTDGHRCGSPALRNEPFCYYHHTTRKPKTGPNLETYTYFDLPLIEDRSSIQAAIGLILQRIANSSLDSKRAGLLLYGLQIASLNLPRIRDTPAQTSVQNSVQTSVEVICEDPTHGTLAPESEIVRPEQERSFLGKIMDEWDQMRAEESVLPTLQAVATPNVATPSFVIPQVIPQVIALDSAVQDSTISTGHSTPAILPDHCPGRTIPIQNPRASLHRQIANSAQYLERRAQGRSTEFQTPPVKLHRRSLSAAGVHESGANEGRQSHDRPGRRPHRGLQHLTRSHRPGGSASAPHR